MYETKADQEREKTTAEEFAEVWKVEMFKLPMRYLLDYAITRHSKVLALAEIKTRNLSLADLGDRGGYSLSLHKWTTAKQLYESSGLTFVLIVKLLDGLYYSRFGEGHNEFIPDDIVITGRIDRGDAQDMEPCVIIRDTKFKKLKD
jgi:hypothetical protein